MAIKITFEFDKLSDAAEFLNKHAPTVQEPRPFEHVGAQAATKLADKIVELAGVTEEARPATKPRKARSAKVSPVSEATAAAIDTAPPTAAITVDDLRGSLKAVLAAKGAAATQSILETFKVARIGELQPAAYAQFVASCNEVIAAK